MKKILNKWQYGVKFEWCPPYRRGFYPVLSVWFLKIVLFPTQGDCISKENYRGLFVEKHLNPIKSVTERVIKTPRLLKRIFPKLYDFYAIPYKFHFRPLQRE